MGKIKKLVKKYLDENIGKTQLKYNDIPADVKYVSFDIFDTLIVRALNKPSDLFEILENQLGIDEFAKKRKEAEQVARAKRPNGEVTIYDIYGCLFYLSPELLDEYVYKELEAELSVCHANRRISDFYNECIRNKKVILISDMYLPSYMMEQILCQCGITGYEKLYISCEAGVSKRKGGLYNHVLYDLKINPKDIVHIGNDFVSDYIKTFKIGIHSMKIKTGRYNYTEFLVN